MTLHRTILLLLPLLCFAPAHADPIRISEVVTDPQSDHNESAGGNGVLFTLATGERG